MTIAIGPYYVGQHVLQYEYKCLLMDLSDRSENTFIMFFGPQNIGLETCYMQLSLILADIKDMAVNRLFVNGGNILRNYMC